MKKVKVDLEKRLLYENDVEFILSDNEYWYLAPNRNTWKESEGLVNPLKFGMVLHNAKTNFGIVKPFLWYQQGRLSKTLKKYEAANAENNLEEYRQKNCPIKPSRLGCYFLNPTKEVALHRAEEWGWKNKSLVRCFIVREKGLVIHQANSQIFEKLVKDPNDQNLISKYWETFIPKEQNDLLSLEILLNGSLYFPEWESFELLDIESLNEWQRKVNEHLGK